ncbi:MAG: PKD domain-containing protein [Prolixibacteraceae bacterium]|jgi:predicted outer membrane repeat protein|nr:PKD domain-containing protein [Prolixibacteraceae bacterium]
MNVFKSLLLLTIILFLSLQCFSENIIFVNQKSNGLNNGESWQNAFISLQEAMQQAETGDQIWVAKGIYYTNDNDPTNKDRYQLFILEDGINIYGGFEGNEETIDARKIADLDGSGEADPWEFIHSSIMSGDIDGIKDDYNVWDEDKSSLYGNSLGVVAQWEDFETHTVLDGFTIQGGYADKSDGWSMAGGLYLLKNIELENCKIQYNYALDAGGGIMAFESTVSQSKIENNYCENGQGGGIYCEFGQTENCVVSSNYSYYEGAGIYCENAEIFNTFIHKNRCDDNGSGVHQTNGKLIDCLIQDNISTLDGGGIYCIKGSIEGCIIKGNKSEYEGGGIYNWNGEIKNSTISHNVALEKGGGIYSNKTNISNSIISFNESEYGGGIYCNEYFCNDYFCGNFIDSTQIFSNKASEDGGGIYLTGKLSNSIIHSNHAGFWGGGIYSDKGEINQCKIFNNSANSDGGGIEISDGEITNSQIFNNYSDYNGGGLSMGGKQTLAINCLIANNKSKRNGFDLYQWRGTISNCLIWQSTVSEYHLQIKLDNSDYFKIAYNGKVNFDLVDEFNLIELDTDNIGSERSPCFILPTSFVGKAKNATDSLSLFECDWQIDANSYCLDKGSKIYATITDFNGKKRDALPDIGAFEANEKSHTIIKPDENGIVYVAENGFGDGSSWDNASNSIKESIEATGVKEIWIMEGTYFPDMFLSNEYLSFEKRILLKNGINIYGGFSMDSPESDPSLRIRKDQNNNGLIEAWEFSNPTVLSGDTDQNDNEFDFDNHTRNNYRIVEQLENFSQETILDGLTISGANNTSAKEYSDGAGLLLKKGTTIRNCIIKSNKAKGNAGGLFSDGANIDNCLFQKNMATNGGGLYAQNTVIDGSLFINNSAENLGGGVFLNKGEINNSIIQNNAAPIGGGIYSEGDVINCNIVRNSADGIANNGFLGNSIVWGNSKQVTQQENSLINYCALETENDFSYEINLELSQLNNGTENSNFVAFKNPSNGIGTYNHADVDQIEQSNWELTATSACINQGINEYIYVSIDYLELPRIQHELIDLGAIEFSGTLLNKKPVAQAGENLSVDENDTFVLDGKYSFDLDDDEISFEWSYPSSFQVVEIEISKITLISPEVMVDTSYTLFLNVSDGDEISTDSVLVQVLQINKAPVAITEGKMVVISESEFTIMGGNSYDPDNDLLTYTWKNFPNELNISDINAANPTVTATKINSTKTFNVILEVNDGEYTNQASLQIRVQLTDEAPVADAGYSFTADEGDLCYFDGSYSYDPEYDLIEYLWIVPEQIQLDSFSEPFANFYAPMVESDTTFTIILEIHDLYNVARDTIFLTVIDKPIHVIESYFWCSPAFGMAPIEIVFQNSSTYTASTFLWDFGDGTTSTEKYPTHLYETSGIYEVSLYATDSITEDISYQTVTIYDANYLKADFMFSPNMGFAPLTVNFYNTSEGNIADYYWEFGDGNHSIEKNPSHIYQNTGTYSVSMVVSNESNKDTLILHDIIGVTENIIEAKFEANIQDGAKPLTVVFTNYSTGFINSCEWDFGDGNYSNNYNPSHIYTEAGEYSVTLTVAGLDNSDQITKENFIKVNYPTSVCIESSNQNTIVFPNPVINTLSIKKQNDLPLQLIEVFNMNGEKIDSHYSNKTLDVINFQNYKKGIYYILVDGKYQEGFKILKK